MKKYSIIIVVILSAAMFFGFSDDSMKYDLGKEVTGITLKTLEGRDFDLSATLKKDEVKGVVFIFVSEQCPVSRACDKRYVEIATRGKKDGILLIGINSNTTESVKVMQGHAKKMGYNFPVLKDWNNVIADRFGAMYTPHVFFVDKKSVLRYRGRIDDNHRNPDKVKDHTLDTAISSYLAGKEIEVTDTKSVGCSIKRVK